MEVDAVTFNCIWVSKWRWGDKMKNIWSLCYSFMRKYCEYTLLIYMIRKEICPLLLSACVVHNQNSQE